MEHWSETKEKLWRHYMHISSMKKWRNWTGSGNKLETCSGLSRHFVTDWKLELVQLCNSFSGAVLKRDLQICVLEPSDKHLYPDWYMRTRTLHTVSALVLFISVLILIVYVGDFGLWSAACCSSSTSCRPHFNQTAKKSKVQHEGLDACFSHVSQE